MGGASKVRVLESYASVALLVIPIHTEFWEPLGGVGGDCCDSSVRILDSYSYSLEEELLFWLSFSDAKKHLNTLNSQILCFTKQLLISLGFYVRGYKLHLMKIFNSNRINKEKTLSNDWMNKRMR